MDTCICVAESLCCPPNLFLTEWENESLKTSSIQTHNRKGTWPWKSLLADASLVGFCSRANAQCLACVRAQEFERVVVFQEEKHRSNKQSWNVDSDWECFVSHDLCSVSFPCGDTPGSPLGTRTPAWVMVTSEWQPHVGAEGQLPVCLEPWLKSPSLGELCSCLNCHLCHVEMVILNLSHWKWICFSTWTWI